MVSESFSARFGIVEFRFEFRQKCFAVNIENMPADWTHTSSSGPPDFLKLSPHMRQVNLGFVVLSTHLRLSSGRSGSRFPVAKAAARRWIQLRRLG